MELAVVDGSEDRVKRLRRKQISISLPPPLIGFIDDEAEKLDLSRSQYLELLCMEDFESKVAKKMFHHLISRT